MEGSILGGGGQVSTWIGRDREGERLHGGRSVMAGVQGPCRASSCGDDAEGGREKKEGRVKSSLELEPEQGPGPEPDGAAAAAPHQPRYATPGNLAAGRLEPRIQALQHSVEVR